MTQRSLLSSFPVPPTLSKTASQSTFSEQDRASEFGFIHVGIIPSEVQNSESPDTAPITVLKDLKLVLDTPAKLYAPREKITGWIQGWNTRDGSHIHIILEGRAKATVLTQDKAGFSDRAPLLYHITHLKPEEQGFVPRFEIRIPETAQPGLEKINLLSNQYWTHKWNPQSPYEHDFGHSLPPSTVIKPSYAHSLRENVEATGYIEYKLTAICSRIDASGTFVPEATFQTPVWLTTSRLTPKEYVKACALRNLKTQNLSIQTLKLLSDRKLSIGELFRDTFSSSVPCFFFKPTISTPRLAVPGQDISISISVEIMPPPPGKLYNFPMPDLRIEDMFFRVRSYQGLRTKGALLTNDRSYTFKDDEIRCTKDLPDAYFRPVKGTYDKQTCVVTFALPMFLTPSYKTYNLWRAYKLECNVTFLCKEKEVTASTKNDLQILARPAGGSDGVPTEAEGELRGYRVENEEAELSTQMAKKMLGLASVGMVEKDQGQRPAH